MSRSEKTLTLGRRSPAGADRDELYNILHGMVGDSGTVARRATETGTARDCRPYHLFELGEGGFDGFEVGEVLRGGGLLGVNDVAGLVDDVGGAGGGVANSGEVGEHDVVGLGHGLVEIAEDGDGDAFLMGPGFLREGAVDADGVDGGVEAFVGGDAAGDVAQFRGADAGEGEREEEKDSILLFVVGAEFNFFETLGGLGHEREVGGFGSGFEGHNGKN